MNERVKSPPSVEARLSPDLLDAVVAIPIHNEREHIVDCLGALAAQTGIAPDRYGLLLFLNNCSDGTAEAISSFAPLPFPLRVLDVHHQEATAGWARRCAMDAAAEWLEESGSGDGTLMTTDADSRVGSDWIKRNLAHIAAGADAVAGRISLDPADAALLPASLHARGRLEGEYEALLTEIGARLDVEPGNPWPCHWTRSGATLAVRLPVYRAVGGMPALAHGEDRAFVSAVREQDFVVRHAPDIEVVTSGRLVGRATGGAADTMKLRCEVPDSPCDDRLEPMHRAVARMLWRRRIRHLHAAGRLARDPSWAPLLGVPRSEAERISRLAFFGQVHAAIEAASPRLRYKPVTPSQLPGQIRRAKLLLAALHRVHLRSAEHRAGRLRFGLGAAIARSRPKLP